jgi:hypothetical protein
MAPLLIDKDGVSIHVQSREHLPPHVHAFSGDDEALVNIRTGEVVAGYLTGKKLKVVQDWLSVGDNRKLVEKNFYELNPRLKPKEAAVKPVIKKVTIKKKSNKKGGK